MNAADLEVVRAAFADWDEFRDEFFERHLHSDVEYREDPEWPGAGTHRGLDAVTECFRDYSETLGFAGAELEQVIPAGEQAVAVIRVAITPHGSDRPVEHRWGYVCRVRDGKIAFFQAYLEPARAFEAAGIEAPARAS